MTFCYSPWTNIDIDPQGIISPCCKFRHTSQSEKLNIQTHTIHQYSKSNLIQQIKKDFREGKWPVGCDRCQIEEQNGIESKRNLDYTRWQDHYESYVLDSDKFITAGIAFGNTCNLKCITCNPTASSRWQAEYKTIHGINISHNKFYKDNFVKELIETAPDLVHLDIYGGEPLLSGVAEQKELLQEYIRSDKSQYISLHYITNATIFPDPEWWEIWSHFRNVDIQLSIDAIHARYEYIRYPGKWDTLVKNAEKYVSYQTGNIQLSVSHTVSAYNIYYLDEFFQWCDLIGLPRPWLGRVHNPAYMRLAVWSTPAKEFIMDHLSNSTYQDVIIWKDLLANSDDTVMFETFKKYLHQHDEYRGTKFSNTFPELCQFI
jgi:MoaA/NifB/PqqE/SkfB family radical SAM enzyme